MHTCTHILHLFKHSHPHRLPSQDSAPRPRPTSSGPDAAGAACASYASDDSDDVSEEAWESSNLKNFMTTTDPEAITRMGRGIALQTVDAPLAQAAAPPPYVPEAEARVPRSGRA